MADWSLLLARTARYYAETARAHGATPQGADWNSAESQQRRFDQFARLLDISGISDGGNGEIAVTDYGCGYGALVDWLAARGRPFSYVGFDVAPEMIALAQERHGARRECRFVTDFGNLTPGDFTVASGIFNVKLETPNEEWTAYVFDVLDRMAALSRRGFAFNLLTLDSDPDRRRDGLYYADPSAIFNHCRTRYSRAVAVLQDYGLYEFTMIVRKGGPPA